MDQETLIQSLTKHIDSLEIIFNWAVVLSIAVAWAGIQRQQQIEALTLKFDRRYAFYSISGLYLTANIAVLILLLRLADLLALLDDSHFLKGLSVLATHSWVLNPFSYFGSSVTARFYSCEGIGLLIVVWWLCNTSLSTLLDYKSNKIAILLLILFLLVGLVSLGAIQRVYGIVLGRTALMDTTLHNALVETSKERFIAIFLGIIVGSLTFVVGNRLQNRIGRSIGDRSPGNAT